MNSNSIDVRNLNLNTSNESPTAASEAAVANYKQWNNFDLAAYY